MIHSERISFFESVDWRRKNQIGLGGLRNTFKKVGSLCIFWGHQWLMVMVVIAQILSPFDDYDHIIVAWNAEVI